MDTPAELILHWYALNARKLPWRDHPDPYAIWVSEIMLQQTRVDTVIPYFEKWMQKFPTITDLAKATEHDVLVTWEGLGYYSRVRNLHKAMQIVMNKYNGKIPEDARELIKLPGIGRYTAGAIASMAFKADEPTLDANIRRVFSRLFDIQENLDSPKGEKLVWSLAEKELPVGRAGDFNQALMDLGATICKPKDPICEQCPFNHKCQAKEKGVQEDRPILKPKPVQPHFTYVAAIVKDHKKFLLIKRPSKGLLGGLWEFPNGRIGTEEKDLADNVTKMMKDRFGTEVMIISKYGVFKHAYTHFRQTVHAYNCMLESSTINSTDICWASNEELLNYPMGKIARLISKSFVTYDEK